MNAETIVIDAQREGLCIELTERATLRLSGKPEVIERWTPELRAHKAEVVAMLQAQQAEALHLAKLAIARAALTDEQKQSRLADLKREPSIARFWAQLEIEDQRNGLTE